VTEVLHHVYEDEDYGYGHGAAAMAGVSMKFALLVDDFE